MFAPPRWVQELLSDANTITHDTRNGLTLSVTAVPHVTFVRVCAHELGDADPRLFEQTTVLAYRWIAEALRGQPACHPVRFWNQIPGIHTPVGSGVDRYMLYNSARFRAFREWFGEDESFDRSIATATGVGHRGQDVIIEALASDKPGLHVQNPRQLPPIRYSPRYGPSPPCFARGTIIHEESANPRLLIGGTASVCGEVSVHAEDLSAQTAETFCNLASLIRASLDASHGSNAVPPDWPALSAIDHARVYYARENQAEEVRRLVGRFLSHGLEVEYVRADLCRTELLIEIEGVARMDVPPAVKPETCCRTATGVRSASR